MKPRTSEEAVAYAESIIGQSARENPHGVIGVLSAMYAELASAIDRTKESSNVAHLEWVLNDHHANDATNLVPAIMEARL